MDVPPDHSSLKPYVEALFNEPIIVESFCHEHCKKVGRGEKRTTLKSIANTRFVLVLLSRAIDTAEGYKLLKNRCRATDKIFLR